MDFVLIAIAYAPWLDTWVPQDIGQEGRVTAHSETMISSGVVFDEGYISGAEKEHVENE